jgi:hypothetical protein
MQSQPPAGIIYESAHPISHRGGDGPCLYTGGRALSQGWIWRTSPRLSFSKHRVCLR